MKKGAREAGTQTQLTQHAHGGGKKKRRGGELRGLHNGINAGGRGERYFTNRARVQSTSRTEELHDAFYERSASLVPHSVRIKGEEKMHLAIFAFVTVASSCLSGEREEVEEQGEGSA